MPLKVVLPLSVCLNAAVCGPFYLVAEVEEVHVKKASQRVIALIFIRALFFCVLVGCACWNVSALGARLFFALPLNQVERPPWLEIWALIYFIYLSSGFFAQLAIEKQCQLNRAKEKASAVQHPQERQSLRRRQSESGRLYPMPPPPPPRKSQLSIKSKVSEITKVWEFTGLSQCIAASAHEIVWKEKGCLSRNSPESLDDVHVSAFQTWPACSIQFFRWFKPP